MATRPGNILERWDMGMVKSMLARNFVRYDLQAYSPGRYDPKRRRF